MTKGAHTTTELRSAIAKIKSTTPRSDADMPVVKKKPNWYQRIIRSWGAKMMWVGR